MIGFLVSTGSALFLAWVMVIAGARKLCAPLNHAAHIDAYELLPDASGRLLVVPLALAEIAAGCALVIGSTRDAGAALPLLLLLIYSAAIAINLWRGRVDIDCGCGVGVRLSAWLLLRNAILMFCAAVVCCIPAGDGERPIWPAVLVSILLALSYNTGEFLLRRDELLRDD
ncbi:MAG: hypothetical protein KA472_10480 [Pseudomonadales bacterium]|nr:hypothetical protein [Pseudomonadales bacterium]